MRKTKIIIIHKMNINKILYNCTTFIFKLIQILYIKKIFLKLYVKYFIRIKNKNNVDILYHSKNFLVVSKPYDMYINSNNHEKKVWQKCFKLKIIFIRFINIKIFRIHCNLN